MGKASGNSSEGLGGRGFIGIAYFGMPQRWKRLWKTASLSRVVEQLILQRKSLSQPIPDVTPDDVRRVVNREFQNAQIATVIDVLSQPINGRPPSSRVQLAVLKLAGGSVERLQAFANSAQGDYRDVLVAAEYPTYHGDIAWNRNVSIKQRNAAIESDWRQYEEWLKK